MCRIKSTSPFFFIVYRYCNITQPLFDGTSHHLLHLKYMECKYTSLHLQTFVVCLTIDFQVIDDIVTASLIDGSALIVPGVLHLG